MNRWKEKIVSIVLILSSLILDGFIANYFSTTLDTNYGLMVPRTIFLIFIMLSFHYDKNFMLTSAVVFGFLMDTYFLGFVGIYILSLVMIVMMISKLKELVHANV
ncbi:MAG: rod shape-determining protein MreD, partial [Atopostipes sp.]|nr:rod shape-determining protein MreD [Atopostipes sp.]